MKNTMPNRFFLLEHSWTVTETCRTCIFYRCVCAATIPKGRRLFPTLSGKAYPIISFEFPNSKEIFLQEKILDNGKSAEIAHLVRDCVTRDITELMYTERKPLTFFGISVDTILWGSKNGMPY